MSNKIIALESEIMQAELKLETLSKENFDVKKKHESSKSKSAEVCTFLKVYFPDGSRIKINGK